MTPPPDWAREWLTRDLAPHWQRVHGDLLEEFSQSWSRWMSERVAAGDAILAAPERTGHTLLDWLRRAVGEWRGELNELHRLQVRFVADHDRADSREERERVILEWARQLGATPRELAGDRRALRYWLDRDAMMDRTARRRAWREQRLALALERMGVVAARVLGEAVANGQKPVAVWNGLALEPLLREMFFHDGDPRVALAALKGMVAALAGLPPGSWENLVAEPTLRYLHRTALESRQDVWLQAEALTLIGLLSPATLVTVLERRLRHPQPGDDLFVRRRAVALLVGLAPTQPSLLSLLAAACDDPSPFVRQGLAQELGNTSCPRGNALLVQLAVGDAEPAVRASALLALAQGQGRMLLPELLSRRFQEERDGFVFRVMTRAAVLTCQGEGGAALGPEMLALTSRAAVHAPEAPWRLWAAQASERLWLLLDPEGNRLAALIRPLIATIPPGGSRRLPGHLTREFSGETMGRVMSVLALDDFPLELSRGVWGWRLHRGHRFGFRWWRFLHEMRHVSPDKRQAFSHVVGRHFVGERRAPSAILAEMSPTRVPGEPLYLEEEGGWRNIVPLPDDIIATLELGRTVHIHTSQGVTEVIPPRSPWRRIRAVARLTWDFARFAALRNQRGGDDPGRYAREINELGCQVRFHPAREDERLTRFFTGFAMAWNSELTSRFEDYFFSAYENAIHELILFASLALALFLGRHYLRGRSMRRERGHLPLVIGGWGTRGKSGTERLKAAVLHARGLGVVSKTTGCEAMFLHGPPFQPMREMFLFRPYDKATIWEQHDLVRLSRRLDCQAFLWECMALTPSYVSLLQRQWMRDDFSTITNAYPDHEDLQGPAGINIPEVIAQFIPARAPVISSEEQMSPILKAEAARMGASLDEVTWLDAGLLTPDILARFPYAEHPNNIALVSRLCQHLGIPGDEALKAMADHVIPDIGVLKLYPPAHLEGRTLSFVNGMSANERLGTLTNWRRTGFANHDPEVEPEVWVTALVNNRADRVARSKVFARLLVQDVHLDALVLIGGNLEGMMGYIEEELAAWTGGLTLGEGDPLAALQALARSLRVPVTPEAVDKRVTAMARGLGREGEVWPWRQEETLARSVAGEPRAEEIITWISRWRWEWEAFQGVADQAREGRLTDDLLRQQARRWFLERITVVWNYHATGNDVVRELVRQTPPGLHNRVMGMQNIKGTGLDFVYRWQAWDQCHAACVTLASDQGARFQEGLRTLSAFRDFGPLGEAKVRESVAHARARPEAQTERAQAELSMIISNLESALARDLATSSSLAKRRGRFDRVIDAIEAFLDAGDAVSRRKTANRIYRDLAAERISRHQASLLLSGLITRQKGGWLGKGLNALFLGTR